jgi:hypothetical protein
VAATKLFTASANLISAGMRSSRSGADGGFHGDSSARLAVERGRFADVVACPARSPGRSGRAASQQNHAFLPTYGCRNASGGTSHACEAWRLG